MEASIGRSSAEVLTEHAVLAVSGFKLAPRPGVFTVLDFHKMDVPLIGWELIRKEKKEKRKGKNMLAAKSSSH